jgi:hypothetical protein
MEPVGLEKCPDCGLTIKIYSERSKGQPIVHNCPGARVSEWSPSQPSRGLGDTIAKLTNAVGIKPCGGCKRRQRALNRLVPYK